MERRKPEFPKKNLSEQSREPTSSTHICRPACESNPANIGGKRVLSPCTAPSLLPLWVCEGKTQCTLRGKNYCSVKSTDVDWNSFKWLMRFKNQYIKRHAHFFHGYKTSLHQIKTAKYHRTYNTLPNNIRQVETFSEFIIKPKRCLIFFLEETE